MADARPMALTDPTHVPSHWKPSDDTAKLGWHKISTSPHSAQAQANSAATACPSSPSLNFRAPPRSQRVLAFFLAFEFFLSSLNLGNFFCFSKPSADIPFFQECLTSPFTRKECPVAL